MRLGDPVGYDDPYEWFANCGRADPHSTNLTCPILERSLGACEIQGANAALRSLVEDESVPVARLPHGHPPHSMRSVWEASINSGHRGLNNPGTGHVSKRAFII